MSTTIRRKRGSRGELGPYKRHELLTGKIDYPVLGYSGYGDGSGTDLEAFIDAEMRRDWIENRTALLAFWKSGAYTTGEIFSDLKPWLFIRGYPGTLPWAAKQFDRKRYRQSARAMRPAPFMRWAN